VVSVATIQPWYFVIWTQDDANNWSTVSSAVSASPPAAAPVFGVATSVGGGGGLTQGGTAWGDYDKDGDLDIVVSGTDGTNNQIRVFKSYGDGTFNSTAVNVAAANAGLKDGDVAFGDFDNDGDLDVLSSGSDGTNRQLRVYKNNGDATFNTTAVEVPGSSNIGLSSGTVAWGDYDNDGDLDVLVSGTDGSNNQLRVYKNKGDSTFDSTAINVAGLNSGLKQGSVAWGDYDKDGDLDILASGTDGTNRQLRVYKNNGDGTFNSTAVNVAGSANIGLSDGRAVWGDFNKDGYLDVVVSGTDGTNYQLRTYANNGDGTFNSTPVNLAGSNLGVSYSAVAVGDYNVDGNPDVLAAGRVPGLVGHWKLDENTGTSAADLSGNGITGTLTNGPTWTTGKYGYAVNFDGADDHVTMGDPNSLDIVGQLTISAWIYPRTTGGGGLGRIFDKNSSVTGTAGYVLYLQNITVTNGLTFGIGDLSGSPARSVISSANAVTLNQWQHVVVTYDGSKLVKIYVNNVVVGSNTFAEFPTANTNNAVIGGRTTSNTRNFDGYIDDVRIYNRALSAAEVLALYQATKSSVGTLRIHKGVGDGTFNATPVEVDAGLEKGNVAWGDADGDGDLDIVTAGSDGSASQLGVYLSTQSLTASNTAPSVPGGLSASFSLNASSVSVASFTWTAGSDSGTGTTTENALGYDIRISTKSDFSPLVAPGEEGASPRLGSYLRPPKIFSGSTAYGVMLKSTDPWNTQGTASYGLRTDTTYYYQVKTVDAGLATSAWSDSGTLNTAVSPSTSTIAVEQHRGHWGDLGFLVVGRGRRYDRQPDWKLPHPVCHVYGSMEHQFNVHGCHDRDHSDHEHGPRLGPSDNVDQSDRRDDLLHRVVEPGRGE
jgi:predicted nucleotidyltransferase